MAEIISSGNLSKSNLISQSYANIHNLINDRSNVADPLDTTGVRKLVYSRTPDPDGKNFQGYPFIVIQRAVTDITAMSLSATSGSFNWEFEVMVYSSDKIRHHTSNGAYYMETIMDAILETVHDTSNRTTLRNYGLANAMPVVEDMDVESIGTDTVFMARISLPFKARTLLS